MPYTDDQTLAEHISQRDVISLTDDEKAAINETDLAAAIVANPEIRNRLDRVYEAGRNQIDSMARKHWEVPICIDPTAPSTPANTPPLVTLLCTQLAIVKLFQRRAGAFTDLPDGVRDIRKEATDFLKMINHGDVDLGINPAPARSPFVVATATSEDRLFTQDTLKDF
jgi:phage gp36-like protein